MDNRFHKNNTDGRLYYSKKAEQRFFFICTMVMLVTGLIFRFL